MTNNAIAIIKGSSSHPNLRGQACFCSTESGGVIITVEVFGLPENSSSGFFGMHIHQFGDCTPPFDKTGSHYNANNQPHPMHAGDLPPLLGNNGYSWMSFYDTRFTVDEIIGKSIIIHNMRDDFTSQPAGDSGDKIGCGVIEKGF